MSLWLICWRKMWQMTPNTWKHEKNNMRKSTSSLPNDLYQHNYSFQNRKVSEEQGDEFRWTSHSSFVFSARCLCVCPASRGSRFCRTSASLPCPASSPLSGACCSASLTALNHVNRLRENICIPQESNGPPAVLLNVSWHLWKQGNHLREKVRWTFFVFLLSLMDTVCGSITGGGGDSDQKCGENSARCKDNHYMSTFSISLLFVVKKYMYYLIMSSESENAKHIKMHIISYRFPFESMSLDMWHSVDNAAVHAFQDVGGGRTVQPQGGALRGDLESLTSSREAGIAFMYIFDSFYIVTRAACNMAFV